MIIYAPLYMASKNACIKHCKCWTAWGVRGQRSKRSPRPTPNSSLSNLSPIVKSERQEMWKRSQRIARYSARTLWWLHEARKWQTFIDCSVVFWKASQIEAAWKRGGEAVRAARNCKPGEVASFAQGRGRGAGGPGPRLDGCLREGSLRLNCASFSFTAKAPFFLWSQRLYLCCRPSSSHSSSALTQAQLKPAVSITRAQSGAVSEYLPRKRAHSAISSNSQPHSNTIT